MIRYRMLADRRDEDLKNRFKLALRDFAYLLFCSWLHNNNIVDPSLSISNLKMAIYSSEEEAVDALFNSIFLTRLEDHNYKLTHMSKKAKEYKIAICMLLIATFWSVKLIVVVTIGGRFVTLVSPKDDWPIAFSGRHHKLPGTVDKQLPLVSSNPSVQKSL